MSTAPRHARFLHIWAVPLLLGALTVFGLLAALLGTGAWHVAAWVAIAVPIVVAVRFGMR